MRNSRQSHCSAAILQPAAIRAANRLEPSPKFEFSDFRRLSPAYDAARPFIHDGTGFKQNLPDA
jgi:hypothetical protein